MSDASSGDAGPGSAAGSDGTTPSEPGYAEALQELEAILTELEHTDVDVDLLAERVQRAAHLIEVCRRRIASARTEVERVVADLPEGGAP
jgi:exodeoxyribonuclease VII small subunit